MDFSSQLPVLCHFKHLGFEPKTIIDCGSHTGEWAQLAQFIYPTTPIHLIDILHIVSQSGIDIDSDIKNGIKHYCAVDKTPGEKLLYFNPMYPALTTLYKDTWNDNTQFEEQVVPVTTLDILFESIDLPEPILLKLDIQGAELPAILGGKNIILPKTDIIILEASYDNFNEGAYNLRETMNALYDLGFDLFEIVPCDTRGILNFRAQCDAFFVNRRIKKLWQK